MPAAFGCIFAGKQHQPQRPRKNRNVRDVERERVFDATAGHVQEIRHRAIKDAVHHIAQSPADQQAGWLRIQVADQGPGVAAEQLDGIFTPFTTSKPEGLGLGLSMSRSIVEGFGGTLQAHPGDTGGLILCCRLAPVASA